MSQPQQSQQQQQPPEDPLKGISDVLLKLFTRLSDKQKALAKKAFEDKSQSDPTFLKGKNLMQLICYDYCLEKYPFFSKYEFDYDMLISYYLETDRYEWMQLHLIETVTDSLELKNIDRDSIHTNALFILTGAFTTETNMKNRQQRLVEVRQILNFIFELNFIATQFTRPSFLSNECQYKAHLNSVKQKLLSNLPFSIEMESEDMKTVSDSSQKLVSASVKKLKMPLFRTTIKFLNIVELVSLGELNKSNSMSLLSREILILLLCFKEAKDIISFIDSCFQREGLEFGKPARDGLDWVINYLENSAKKKFAFAETNESEAIETLEDSKTPNVEQEQQLPKTEIVEPVQEAKKLENEEQEDHQEVEPEVEEEPEEIEQKEEEVKQEKAKVLVRNELDNSDSDEEQAASPLWVNSPTHSSHDID